MMTEKPIKMPNYGRPRWTLSRYHRYGWFFISFAVLVLALFMLYPIISSLIMSTYSSRGMIQRFVGLGNYQRLLKDRVFLQALKNTLIFFIVQVPIMLLLALLIATLLNNKDIKFRALPHGSSTHVTLVTYSTLFKMMFSLEGLNNKFLLNIKLISTPSLLVDPFGRRLR